MLSIRLHPLLNPPLRLLRNLLRLGLILQNLLDSMRTRHMSTLLDALPSSHSFLPRLEIRELLDIDSRPPGRSNPSPMRDIRNTDVITNKIPGLGLGEVRIQHAV